MWENTNQESLQEKLELRYKYEIDEELESQTLKTYCRSLFEENLSDIYKNKY